MAFDTTQSNTDLSTILGDFSVTMTVNGVDCGSVSRGRLSAHDLVESYGSGVGYRFSVWARESALPSATPMDTEPTVNGTVYRVMGVGRDDADQLTRLDLMERY